MIKWFKNCQTAESIKERYKNLVKQYHPDVSNYDSTAEMQEINAEFEEVFNKYKNFHESVDGKIYHEDVKEEAGNPNEAREFMEIINSLAGCDGIKIQLVGRWIWLEGNTYSHKELISSLGFKWAGKKKAWYWHKLEDACHNRKKMSLEDIKAKYGCKVFRADGKPLIA